MKKAGKARRAQKQELNRAYKGKEPPLYVSPFFSPSCSSPPFPEDLGMRKPRPRRSFRTIFHALVLALLFLLLAASEIHSVSLQNDLDRNTEYLARCVQLLKGDGP